jgi:hypothetical protein
MIKFRQYQLFINEPSYWPNVMDNWGKGNFYREY